MRYALLVCVDENAVISEQERSRRAAAAASFEHEMRARGVLLASDPLHPAETATSVRCRVGGERASRYQAAATHRHASRLSRA